jgi:hypothetical protein
LLFITLGGDIMKVKELLEILENLNYSDDVVLAIDFGTGNLEYFVPYQVTFNKSRGEVFIEADSNV